MADYPPLVLVAGVRQQLQAADTVLANGITARTGTNLALTADGGQLVTIPANVDLQFGAVDSQIGSAGALIEVQNLLDKTDAETITGAWTYNNNIAFDNGTRTIAGIQNQNLVDKTAAETITQGVGDSWNFISSGDNTSPNLSVQATAAQEASTNRVLFQVLASGGGNLFSVDSEGDVQVAGSETVSGASTVVGTANFQGDVNLGNGGDAIAIGSGPTDTVTFGGPITITIPDTENWTAITIDNNDSTNEPDAFRVHGANTDTIRVDYDEVEVNTTAGDFDVNSGGAITMDAASASNLTVTGATLTLANTGANELDITSGGLLDINAGANLDVDATGTMAFNSTDTTNLTMLASDAATKTLTIAANNAIGDAVLALSSNAGAGSAITLDTGAADIDITAASGTVDIDAGVSVQIDSTGGLVDIGGGNITLDATVGISLDAGGASNFTVTGNTLTLSNTGANELDITSGGLLDINAGANLDIDVTGSFDMLASTTFAISGTGASSVNATSGTLTLSSTTSGDVAVDSAAEILFDDTNRSGSTWAATSVKLTETTGEWDTYESNFGEVSIFNALNQAYSAAGGAVQEVLLQSLTTAGMAAGDIAYLSANDTVLQADADSTLGVARAMGVYNGTAREVVIQGRVDVTLNDGVTPSAGAPIYVSTVAGRGTATAPSGSGEYVTCIGYVVDNTGYAATPGNTVEILLGIERPVLV